MLDIVTVLLAAGGLALMVIGARPAGPPVRAAEAAEPIPGPPTTGVSAPASPARSSPAGSSPVAAPSRDAGPAPLRPVPLGPSPPARLDIPAIGVSTSLMAVGLNADGTIAVPPLRRDAPAAWYRHLASPGEVGPAVIVGHVDTARDGPAVFFRLRDLRPGDTVTVRRADGATAVFTISQVQEYPKSAFPTGAVYGAVDHPVLRLVTCGGTFDPIRRRYRGNVVAYADLTATA